MLNLLPEYQKKKVMAEYRFRLIVMIIALICVAAVIFSIFTLPAYVYARTKNVELKSQKSGLDSFIQVGNASGTGQDGGESFSKSVDALKPFADTLNPILTLNVVAPMIPGIKISGYTITPVGDNTAAVTLSGIADSREALTTYTAFLNGRFGGVKLPLSSLAKPNDIPFGFRFQVDTVKAATYISPGSAAL